MALKFINAGGFGTVADALEAMNYAIDRKRAGVNLRIINVSWGLTERSRALEDAVRSAHAAGILFVCASGSASGDGNGVAHYPSAYKVENILSVAALTRDGELAKFSNYGNDVNLAAPGERIFTTTLGNEFADRSGTSLAAAVVSGVAALVVADRPELSVEQLRSILLRSVDKKPSLADKVTSEGSINAAQAVSR